MKRSLPYETYVAMKRLKHEDIWYERVSPYHLKVDAYNLYPKRGIIHVDGEPDAFPQRGLEVFVKLVKTDASVMARLHHNSTDKTIPSSDNALPDPIILKLR